MKLSYLITANAFLALGAGIAFAMYAPVMMAFFGIPDLPGDNILLYWSTVSFARMFGTALFGLGILLWALRSIADSQNITDGQRSGILFALLFANAIASFVSITQQFSIWQGLAGWVTFAVFTLFTLGYAVFLFSGASRSIGD